MLWCGTACLVQDLEGDSEEGIVLKRARAAGQTSTEKASALLDKAKFDDALAMVGEARKSYSWVAATEHGDGKWETTTGLRELEALIHQKKSLAEGQALLVKAKASLSRAAYDESLDLMHQSIQRFDNAQAQARVKEVELLVADTVSGQGWGPWSDGRAA
jgi:hypothetical protein